MQMKMHSEAIEALTRATKLAPANALAHAYLGDSSFERERCETTIPAFRSALALAPNHADAWHWNSATAGCYMHVQEPENAIPFCERAVALQPTRPRTQMCLAKAYFGAEKYEAALSVFVRVYSSTTEPPYSSEARDGALVSLAKLRKLNQAVNLLKLDPQQYPSEAALQRAVSSAITTTEDRQWRKSN
jgi:tetratricopeptide (TPR) repeat protein